MASKANIAAELTFDGSDLTYDLPGYDGQSAGLTVPRSTPTNIMFHNDGDDDARLVIEMHPRLDDDGNPTGPERICTALGEPGSTQFLTLVFALPSSAVEGGYAVHRARHRRQPPGGRTVTSRVPHREGRHRLRCPNVPVPELSGASPLPSLPSWAMLALSSCA